jgi:16S rRNA (uracil1498-N3)-methyltransferase
MGRSRAPLRRFFLDGIAGRGGPRLLPADEQHALRVLRLAPGDELVGLDGRGGRWPLKVAASERATLRLEPSAAPTFEPAPGEPGAPLPWIELAVCLPKGGRAEDMLDRLTQLGAAALTPLVAEHSEGAARDLSPARRERLERVAREACKQADRAWLPLVLEPLGAPELAAARSGARLAVLDPGGTVGLPGWVEGLPRPRPRLVVAVGPEGGWTEAEVEGLARAGAERVLLGPHPLRIETAAEAALAGLVQQLHDPRAS